VIPAGEHYRVMPGDCLESMRSLPDACVQMGCTSPPCDDLRTYGQSDTPSWDFEAIARELYRVLCPGGVLCWNVGDSVVDGSETLTSAKQKIFFRKCGFLIHDTMIYEKSNFGHPEKCRYHQLFEYIFVLSKGRPRAFNPLKDKPNAWAGTGPFGVSTMRQRDGSQKPKTRNIIAEYGMRGNVWRGNTRGQKRTTMCSWCAR